MVKTICMYLPQFHRTAENDRWWGEGYTEWSAVKDAKSYYPGHSQPKKPFNDNYYNLLDKKTMEWQADLMKTYGIDGLCFYHYYFEDGKMALEKPAENLLQWREISMPYCFCWANTSWKRSWSKLRGGAWNPLRETDEKAEEDGMLLRQRYGREAEWKKHFDYLLPFFVDERYIRIDGKPVFIFHEPSYIYSLKPMIEYWRDLAKDAGLGGLYLIGFNAEECRGGLDAVTVYLPAMFFSKCSKKLRGNISIYDYEELWHLLLKYEPVSGSKTYFGGMISYDDTPRRGDIDGNVVEGFSLLGFKKCLTELYRKSFLYDNELIFLNAWNEWGEGMYLEPDEQYKTKLLETVEEARKEAGLSSEKKQISYRKKEVEIGARKLQVANKKIKCFDQWLLKKEMGRGLLDYFAKHKISNVAIYGIGMLGEHLITEIEKTGVKIDFIIDKRSVFYEKSIRYDLIHYEDTWPITQAIIVTVMDEYDQLYDDIRKKTNAKVFHISELIDEM